jgi:acetyltransferase-like isoleucine patch superfamily enzyme
MNPKAKSGYYDRTELVKIGFNKLGDDVLISRKTSIYNPELIEIGNNVRIDDFCILSGKIYIGNNIHISAYVALYGKYGIKINDFAGISPKSVIFSATDDFSGKYMVGPMISNKITKLIKKEVIIEKFVQIGAGCIIMPGVILKEGAAIGAMSFVNKIISEWTIAVGIPCKEIKKRRKNILHLYKKYFSNDF